MPAVHEIVAGHADADDEIAAHALADRLSTRTPKRSRFSSSPPYSSVALVRRWATRTDRSGGRGWPSPRSRRSRPASAAQPRRRRRGRTPRSSRGPAGAASRGGSARESPTARTCRSQVSMLRPRRPRCVIWATTGTSYLCIVSENFSQVRDHAIVEQLDAVPVAGRAGAVHAGRAEAHHEADAAARLSARSSAPCARSACRPRRGYRRGRCSRCGFSTGACRSPPARKESKTGFPCLPVLR